MTLVFLCGCQQILQKCTMQLYSQITCYLQITLLLSTRFFIYGNELNIENEEIMILIIIIIIIKSVNTSLLTDGWLSCKVVFNINGSAR